MWKNLLFVLAIRSNNHRARAYAPLALHHLYELGQEHEIVISLRGHDLDGDEVSRFLSFGTIIICYSSMICCSKDLILTSIVIVATVDD